MEIKSYYNFINESFSNIDEIISYIEKIRKKIKLESPYRLYDDGLETAINNSEITSFYRNYKIINNKKYIKSIPFPFEKVGDNIQRFDKLNKISKIYENNEKFKLVKYICLQLMDVILYDMYFDIKSRRFDVYDVVDNMEIPDESDKNSLTRFAKWILSRDGEVNLIIFYTNTDDTLLKIRNYQI